jgi:hypothetical protein
MRIIKKSDRSIISYDTTKTKHHIIQKSNHDVLKPNDNVWVGISHTFIISVAYTNIFATGSFMGACFRWNEKEAADNTWANFKNHCAATHCQHKQMQGGSAANYGYDADNAAVGQTEDQMVEATIGALANLAIVTAAERGVVWWEL